MSYYSQRPPRLLMSYMSPYVALRLMCQSRLPVSYFLQCRVHLLMFSNLPVSFAPPMFITSAYICPIFLPCPLHLSVSSTSVYVIYVSLCSPPTYPPISSMSPISTSSSHVHQVSYTHHVFYALFLPMSSTSLYVFCVCLCSLPIDTSIYVLVAPSSNPRTQVLYVSHTRHVCLCSLFLPMPPTYLNVLYASQCSLTTDALMSSWSRVPPVSRFRRFLQTRGQTVVPRIVFSARVSAFPPPLQKEREGERPHGT